MLRYSDGKVGNCFPIEVEAFTVFLISNGRQPRTAQGLWWKFSMGTEWDELKWMSWFKWGRHHRKIRLEENDVVDDIKRKPDKTQPQCEIDTEIAMIARTNDNQQIEGRV
ncbi:Phosphopantothenate--cysteine ligase CAB2 [Fusarium oxysporum f. sp. albedinis]|nr:Phosphopantothenate--cysteine ligase CAB2 [Fusarium oxysporum f. sp. albedinis]